MKKCYIRLIALFLSIGMLIPFPGISSNAAETHPVSEPASSPEISDISLYGGKAEGGIVGYHIDEIIYSPDYEETYDSIVASNIIKGNGDTFTGGSVSKATAKDIVKTRDWYSYGIKNSYYYLTDGQKKLYRAMYQYCLYFLTTANTNSEIETNYQYSVLNVNGVAKRECISKPFVYSAYGVASKDLSNIFMIF